jgi:hypothetical protein
MKRIKFEKIAFNKYSLVLWIFAILLILLGSGLLYNYDSIFLVFIGVLIMVIDLSRFFWFKNSVKYNSKVVYIRLNSLLGKKFTFNTITNVKVTSKQMIITANNTEHVIDLYRIDRNDIDDLADIVVDKSGADYESDVMHEQFYQNS